LAVAGRLLLICGTLLVSIESTRGDGRFQSTRDGNTLVWNNHPKPGDVAAWSGARDARDYAHGFGQLSWYTKERGFVRPQLYARYWGRMVDGKLEGPVNVHAQRKTHYAIFIDGTRVTGWTRGTAPSHATARWRAMVAKHRTNVEPESPAAGPIGPSRSGLYETAEDQTTGRTRGPGSSWNESIQDLWSNRWQRIDIDESLRVLALPPRSLRVR
jgi:hypothetical protein